MSLDLAQVRADTPGLAHVNHLLACGAALMPAQVVEAMIDHIRLEARMGGYEAAEARAEPLNAVYDKMAGLINAKAGEIALVENATVAWSQVFYALPMKQGDRILTCQAEYAANYLAYLQRAKRDGVVIEVIPNDASGALDVTALEAMIDERVALISITWVPTNGGLVNPAQAVGKVAARHDIPYLLDACQAVGQMPVDVRALNCDYLSATARKFLRGPRGIGFLYVRERRIAALEPAMIDLFSATWDRVDGYRLRKDARRFENWENAYALRAGLGAAVDVAQGVGMQAIQARATMLATQLRDGLRHMGANLHDAGENPSAIVSFSLDGRDPDTVVAALKAQGIVIGTSGISSTRLDYLARGLPDLLLRAAPHYYNSEEDVAHLLAALAQ